MSTGDRTAGGHHRPYRRLAVGLAAAIVIIAISWLVATGHVVSREEERAFRIVNNAPDALWPLLWPVMQLGNLAAPIAAAGVVTVAWRRWRPATALLLAAYGSWAVAQLVKHLVARARPDNLLSDVVLHEGVEGLGFVSGHSAIATAMATVMWPYLGWRGRTAVVALSALVGIGRIYAGAHLPLDVVGGAAIGVLMGLATSGVLGLPYPGRGRDRAHLTATKT